MTENQKVHLNAFNCIPGVGYGTLKNINEYFKGDFEAGFKGSESHFRNAGIKGKNKIDSEKEWKKLEKEKVKMIVFDEPEFPKLLKHIPDAPVLFYMKGELKKELQYIENVTVTRDGKIIQDGIKGNQVNVDYLLTNFSNGNKPVELVIDPPKIELIAKTKDITKIVIKFSGRNLETKRIIIEGTNLEEC